MIIPWYCFYSISSELHYNTSHLHVSPIVFVLLFLIISSLRHGNLFIYLFFHYSFLTMTLQSIHPTSPILSLNTLSLRPRLPTSTSLHCLASCRTRVTLPRSRSPTYNCREERRAQTSMAGVLTFSTVMMKDSI